MTRPARRQLVIAWLFVTVTAGGPAAAAPVTVPANVGVGPAVHLLSGPLQDAQTLHYGLKLSIYALIDGATLRAQRDRIPKRYRKMALKMDEVRVSPSIFIPDTLFLSPRAGDAQMWGVSWAPFGLGLPLVRRPFRLWLGTSLRLTYAYIDSDAHGTTHFLRPGLDLKLDLEIPLGDSFALSVGWDSMFHIPQALGAGVFDTAPLRESLWHIGQGYVLLNFRFPYTANL